MLGRTTVNVVGQHTMNQHLDVLADERDDPLTGGSSKPKSTRTAVAAAAKSGKVSISVLSRSINTASRVPLPPVNSIASAQVSLSQ